ncbi:hypothetical protein LC087_00750 [Bacillus carboniphilus]|uniref:ATP-grasp domain-containing protein n=1 Tax=Bacillus carboniphilus TaxID=86663 RepID=A0ABY9JTT5_9BACI|nr:YheC/YheD family protein [Bacillus carboniphilus]WLR42806.1 hypothetical protein LC087_00750 [Bacillus carboniphilus]
MIITKTSLRKLKSERNTSTVAISTPLASLISLGNKNNCRMKIGGHTILVSIVCINETDSCIYISNDLINLFSLPFHPIDIHLRYDEKINVIEMGPVIAIVTEVVSSSTQRVHFGNIHDFCIEMHEECLKRGALFYVTSMSSLATEEKRIEGYIFDNEKWTLTPVPYPSIVHNRIHSRRMEQSVKFRKLLQKLHYGQTPIFNERFLNKWEVHELLLNQTHLLPYLPQTERILSQQQWDIYVNDFEKVYLKPIYGSQGKKIMVIKKTENGQFIQVNQDDSQEPINQNEMYEKIYPTVKKRTLYYSEGHQAHSIP